MKQRFSSLDVKVITQELASECVNLRVSNIYDLSSRIFLFKLAKPDHRRQLIIDSGFRTHVTQYSRTAASTPSPFVTRLRKYLKSRRITGITQIGTDRIIDFSFSDGAYHIFLEFFAGGNIILTDREYNIIAFFRQVAAGVGQEEIKAGLKYTVSNKQNYDGVPDITANRVLQTLEKAQGLSAQEENAPKKFKKKGTDVLRKALSQGFPEYPPLLLDHVFAIKEFDTTTPLDQVLGSPDLLQTVKEVLEEARRISNSFDSGGSHPGYIVAKEDTRPIPEGETSSKAPGLLYEDFHPFKPRQFENKPGIKILEFERFNATVDEYFSSLESQRLESRLTEREEAAKKKLESVRSEHKKRIDELKTVQELHIRKADAIQDNVYRVQEAMDAVNGLVAQGMDWGEIARLIEMEQDRGNPVAQTIKLPLKLYENTITLLLGEAGDDEDEDEEFSSSDESDSDSDNEAEQETGRAERESNLLTIDIDLSLSPWANASQYYDQKKQASEKEQRTTQSSTKALKSHEKKVTTDLKRGLKKEKQVLRQARTPFWFEKFIFFISSEGYLVIGARDAMQSELIYRRYLSKGDIFVHADLEGATPIVVKNRAGSADAPISPSTLSQAGNLCVATSTAWDSKAVMSAWWAHAHQVSKIAENGSGIMPTGVFQIKGEKNFLAPSQLVLGFGIMFQVSQESVRNHKQRFETPDIPNAAINPADETEASEPKETLEPEASGQTEATEEATEDAEKEDAESEEEDEDEKAATRNPLQRGNSELSVSQPTQELASESESEPEEEPKDELEKEVGEVQGEEATPAAGQNSVPEKSEERNLNNREQRASGQGKLLGQEQPAPRITPTRGKRAKDKRAAAKYAHQDDDERELALRLVGANKGKAAKAAKAAEAKEQREREAEAQRQRRRAQHERAAEAERKRQAQFTENGTDDYNEETAAAEAADLTWIPALVGTPTIDDQIIAAIPVCAPWAALGRYKYKVKLQPGSVKKGKAVKEIVGRWVSETTTGKVKKEHAEDVGISRVDAERLREREGELIKGWKDTEIINTMVVGKVRIMTAGAGSGGGGDKGKGKGGKGGGGGGGGRGGGKGKKK
ncbi:hypothetical protein DTO013E5_7740 [Penicillium roqueforti]|uniref:Ribosome quality control complex subunit 2 n=1 Tax=Penicillium roqueforti (strain FM164) TaxID=1365484 RepID=W6PWM3_PENRF|nr:uncharacterized protein LCP9604111_7986 [Penicillium roqueforti]CDM26349.1 Fibronectin-binding A, N-terminal [Penicillium roqueforti FM164]KAF9242422.1 hypothetical protein LCP9604111_7986 [Penicillium roqueforti]KAI1834707.1 hypothetical protein CBS147337_4261 [Penicillium roqueforti]KAI2676550.1 hypothetical protein CBS147355_5652 [Penicillium roqueforti]KAI2681306.1 hypothetical protein LCP963914a_6816 [Penicillium roqueforti]